MNKITFIHETETETNTFRWFEIDGTPYGICANTLANGPEPDGPLVIDSDGYRLNEQAAYEVCIAVQFFKKQCELGLQIAPT